MAMAIAMAMGLRIGRPLLKAIGRQGRLAGLLLT
jgi:hypothetical protein